MRKTIRGVVVVQRVDLQLNHDLVRRAQRTAVSEVVEQSASLSLDDPKDRATLVKRIQYALGIDK